MQYNRLFIFFILLCTDKQRKRAMKADDIAMSMLIGACKYKAFCPLAFKID